MSDLLASALGVQNLASQVTVIKSGPKAKDPISKAEGKLLRSNALTVDDGQTTTFDSMGKGKVVKPTYDPILLTMLTQQNNTLLQCSAAMEVNIDGTGYEIERLDGEAVTDSDKEKIKQIKQFFDEAYPGESFVTQRRTLRRHLEATGCGYLEVIRDVGGKIVFTRVLDSKLMRLVMLDDPVPVEKTINRMGNETKVHMMVRERRFCQQVGSKFRFFKEFKASRDVDMLSGEWLDPKTGLPAPGTAVMDAGYNTGPKPAPAANPFATSAPNALADAINGMTTNPANPTQAKTEPVGLMKGTEVIFFGVVPDVGTGYSVPRWINQMPSVLGSRKAEEFNLDFFNSGGLPPAMILVQGGQLSPDSKVALTNYLSGKAKFKQRGVIAEIFPASGDISSAGSVKVTVERFGDERQKDSMFQTYDANCGTHVRASFRLPSLFLGMTEDMNFATAYASYMVAEAQVFRPEREEFDEIVNVKLMRELAPDYIFRSLPLTITDVEMQLKALTLVKDLAEPEEFIKTVNEIASVTLTAREDLDEENALGVVNQLLGRDLLGNKLDKKAGIDPKTGKPFEQEPGAKKPAFGKKGAPAANGEEPSKVTVGKKGLIAKMSDDILGDLADDWAHHLSGRKDFEPASVNVMNALINSFEPQVRILFNKYVAIKMVNASHDVDGTSMLVAAAGQCLNPATETP